MTIKLTVGDMAPNVELVLAEDRTISLAELQGKYVVLYFYPKDNTPGCTIEAKEFNQLLPEFKKLNAEIIGISRDNLQSHNKFKEKYCLDFALAADDQDNLVSKAFGTLVPKSMFGRQYMGINRASFLIDPQGKIAYIWPEVKFLGHAAQVLEVLSKL